VGAVSPFHSLAIGLGVGVGVVGPVSTLGLMRVGRLPAPLWKLDDDNLISEQIDTVFAGIGYLGVMISVPSLYLVVPMAIDPWNRIAAPR
jgi:hypothetical protein